LMFPITALYNVRDKPRHPSNAKKVQLFNKSAEA